MVRVQRPCSFRTRSTKRAVRSIAIWIWSIAVAKHIRRNPSPVGPNAPPGTAATFSSCNNRTAKSREPRPVLRMSGNA